MSSHLKLSHDRLVFEGQEVARPADIRDYGRTLWRRKFYVLVAIIAAVAVAVLLTNSRHKHYQAASVVLTSLPSSGQVQPTVMDTEIKILESSAVRSLVLKTDPGAGGVIGVQEGDSAAMTVVTDGTTPGAAIKDANAFAQAYVTYEIGQQRTQILAPVQTLQAQDIQIQAEINTLTSQLEGPLPSAEQQEVLDRRNALVTQQLSLESQIQQAQAQSDVAPLSPAVLTPAAIATATGAGRATYIGLGVGAGLVVGLALAFLFEYLDDSITKVEDAEQELGTRIPVLGTVPDIPRRRKSTPAALVGLHSPGSPAAESYRAVRSALHFLGRDAAGATLQLTAPTFGEGTTTTAANLAVLMARTGVEVVLVDGNLRRPGLGQLFNCDTSVGLSSVIIGDATLEAALHRVPGLPSLSVLPAGPVPPNPSELLASHRFVDVLAALQNGQKCIVVDSAPLLPVSDGLYVASAVQGVVVVTSAKTGRRRLREAVGQLAKGRAPLVGVVLNRLGKPAELEGIWTPVATNGKRPDSHLTNA